MSPSELINELNTLHQRGLPLNITAVKRYSPRLVEAAFAQKPFLGWRNALKMAGIPLDQVVWQLQQTVDCEICGKAVKNLSNHVVLGHLVPWKTYKAEHPNAEVIPEQVRANRMEKTPTALPHWEPVWTPEYVLDRLNAWHEGGFMMNSANIQRLDHSLFGFSRTLWPKHSFDDLLRMIGIDPDTVRIKVQENTVTREWVIERIRVRHAKGLPVIASSLLKGKHRDSVTIHHSWKFFTSWADALRAAGLEPAEVGVHAYGYTTKEHVLAEIQRHRDNGLPINYQNIRSQNGPLLSSAMRLFGSWTQALAAMGISKGDVKPPNYQTFRKMRKYGQAVEG